jgi:UDP-N-acetylglucosamine 2-epimerase (non-hydrolysing)
VYFHVVGARPNFPKMAPVYAALAERGCDQVLVHTGQHFDDAMSGVFFRQLGVPEPDLNLAIRGGGEAATLPRMTEALVRTITAASPEAVIVYGDVTSTVAASLAANKLRVPIVHVESGLRSGDRSMPEEINRVITDHVADRHFATSVDAVSNLASEGISGAGVHFVGNPMIDTLLANLAKFSRDVAERVVGTRLDDYAVVTMHRPTNVDTLSDAREVVRAVRAVAELLPVVFALHPRGRATLLEAGLGTVDRTTILDPVGYVEFLSLVRHAQLVITDSGGVQEETTLFDVPCLTLRENTERPVTITDGTNRLVGRAELAAVAAETLTTWTPHGRRPLLWDGNAGKRIAHVLTALPVQMR